MMQLQHNVSLKPYNTFGIDVSAEELSVVNNTSDLMEILEYTTAKNKSLFILGGGSNVLFTGNVKGLVIKNEIPSIEIISETTGDVLIKAGAGVNWHSFVLFCLENNFAGVENLALIPGNTGASPMQNIGAYGVEIKDVFHSLNAVHIHDRTTISFSKNDCAFGYRESVFKRKYKNKFIITDVTFRLSKKPVFHTSYGAIESELERMHITDLSIQSIAQAVINIRTGKLPDPEKIGNAGSFFKNPEVPEIEFEKLKSAFPSIVGYKTNNGIKLAAAWLIEQCGWKGYREGDAGCHIHQPLVLVNYGNASGNEILNLSAEIISSVQDKFQVILEREVNVI